MTAVYSDESVVLHHGDCLDVMAAMPDASVDAVVTDPPYGLEFMGKEWDAPWKKGERGDDAAFTGTGYSDGADRLARPTFTGNPNTSCLNCGGSRRGQVSEKGPKRCRCDRPSFPNIAAIQGRAFQQWCEQWTAQCLRVLKPGGYLLAFGGSRTWHRLAVAVEDAGFEMRDSIAWLYGSGFPKSLNLTGDRQGWGTALKPAFEPIVVARKPLAGTVAANVLAHGTGALNVDGCRTTAGQDYLDKCASVVGLDSNRNGDAYGEWTGTREDSAHAAGRWPTNVVLDDSQATELDATSPHTKDGVASGRSGGFGRGMFGDGTADNIGAAGFGGEGGPSRFFPTFRYEAKAPTDERPRVDGVAHPTVKPLDLMRWLVRLVTPPGGTVLEPFAGSGTTAEACVIEGFRCIAIEREAAYLPLIEARLSKPIQPDLFGGAA